jgi:hypothetical protein
MVQDSEDDNDNNDDDDDDRNNTKLSVSERLVFVILDN